MLVLPLINDGGGTGPATALCWSSYGFVLGSPASTALMHLLLIEVVYHMQRMYSYMIGCDKLIAT